MVSFFAIYIFSSSSMLIELGTVVVDFGLGFDFTSAFEVYFDFLLEAELFFAL